MGEKYFRAREGIFKGMNKTEGWDHLGGTRWDHAVVEDFVVEGVRKRGRLKIRF